MWYCPEKNETYATHSEIRKAFSSMSIPNSIQTEHLDYLGVSPLVYVMPDVDPHEIAEPAGVLEVDDQWVQQWTVRDRSADEMPAPEEPPAVQVPQQITAGQGREALYNVGLFANVQPDIDAIEDADTKWRVQNAWDNRPTWERQSPFVAMTAGILGLDESALDQLFISAAQL